jgi:hypothetical protein
LQLKATSASTEESPSNAGYGKIMNIVNELIYNNRKQLQEIIRINHRVEGQCLVSSSSLKSRAANFKSLLEYFKLHAQNTLKEKSESIDMRNSRKSHVADYSTAQDRFKRVFATEIKKWSDRITTATYAIEKVDGAIKAVTEWKPQTSHSFIETSIKETVNAYTKSTHYPLVFDYTFVQLAANDLKIKRRLFQWLQSLKATLVHTLGSTQNSKFEVERLHNELNNDLTRVITLLNQDVRRLDHIIGNVENLINSYSTNESIYSGLLTQTNLVIGASKIWCNTEFGNFKLHKDSMSEHL